MASNVRHSNRRLLVEFLVIFSGVVLGLFADDWRQERNDAKEGVAALRLLQSDLIADSTELVYQLREARRDSNSTSLLIETWDDLEASSDSLESAIYSYYTTAYYQPSNSTYESLKAENRLSLIQDKELRAGIIEYFQNLQIYLQQVVEISLDASFKTMEEFNQDHIRLSPKGSRWGQVKIQSSLEVLYADEELRNAIAWSGWLSQYAVKTFERGLKENAALRARIAAILD